VLQLVFGVSACLAGPGPLVLLVNGWFNEGKSSATGVLFTAFGVAGMFLPPLVATVGESKGWRAAYALVAGLGWFVAFPSAAIIRDGPHTASSLHTSCSSTSSALSPALELKASTVSEATAGEHAYDSSESTPAAGFLHSGCISQLKARSPWWLLRAQVWHLAAFGFWALFVTQALNNFLTLYLNREAGVPLKVASLFTSIIFALNLTGKVLFGFLLDLRRGYRYALGALCFFVIGLAMLPHTSAHADHARTEPSILPPAAHASAARLANGSSTALADGGGDGGDGGDSGDGGGKAGVSHTQLLAFALVYGLGYGGVLTIVASKAIALYGGFEGLPKLQGFLLTWQRSGIILGVAVTGSLGELTGSFVLPFTLLLVFAMLAAVHFVCIHTERCEDACGSVLGHRHRHVLTTSGILFWHRMLSTSRWSYSADGLDSTSRLPVHQQQHTTSETSTRRPA